MTTTIRTQLTPTETEVFLMFAELYATGKPFTLQDIANRRGCKKESVWEIKQKLVQYGLIAKKPDAYKRWKLTQFGLQVKEHMGVDIL